MRFLSCLTWGYVDDWVAVCKLASRSVVVGPVGGSGRNLGGGLRSSVGTKITQGVGERRVDLVKWNGIESIEEKLPSLSLKVLGSRIALHCKHDLISPKCHSRSSQETSLLAVSNRRGWRTKSCLPLILFDFYCQILFTE